MDEDAESSPWNSPGQNTGVGSPSLLQVRRAVMTVEEVSLSVKHEIRSFINTLNRLQMTDVQWTLSSPFYRLGSKGPEMLGNSDIVLQW